MLGQGLSAKMFLAACIMLDLKIVTLSLTNEEKLIVNRQQCLLRPLATHIARVAQARQVAHRVIAALLQVVQARQASQAVSAVPVLAQVAQARALQAAQAQVGVT